MKRRIHVQKFTKKMGRAWRKKIGIHTDTCINTQIHIHKRTHKTYRNRNKNKHTHRKKREKYSHIKDKNIHRNIYKNIHK